jgi:hypothetical protein
VTDTTYKGDPNRKCSLATDGLGWLTSYQGDWNDGEVGPLITRVNRIEVTETNSLIRATLCIGLIDLVVGT